jgi:Domain of unknown function (DUF4831)
MSRNQPELSGALTNWLAFTEANTPARDELVDVASHWHRLDTLIGEIRSAPDATQEAALKQEQESLLNDFLGVTEHSTWTGQFRYVPRSRGIGQLAGSVRGDMTLFTLYQNGGIGAFNIIPENMPAAGLVRSRDILGGKKWVVSIAYSSKIPADTAIWDRFLTKKGKRGWYYRIPADSQVALVVNRESKASSRVQIAQHGCVAFLPPTASSAKIQSNIDLDPNTGGVDWPNGG